MRTPRRILLSLLLLAGLSTMVLPAQAGPTNVVICNAAVSDDVSIYVDNNYWTEGYQLFRGQCNTFGRSGLAVILGGPVTRWRVRTNPGTYGSWQTKDVSYPGSHDRYEYWVQG